MEVKYQSNLDASVFIEMEYTEENLKTIQDAVLQKQLENPDNPIYFDGIITFNSGEENEGIDQSAS